MTTIRSLIVLLLVGCMSPQVHASGGGTQVSSTPRNMRIKCEGQGEGAWLSLQHYRALRFKRYRRKSAHWAHLGKAHYEATYTTRGLQIKATAHIEARGKGWHQLAVLPMAYPLLQAKLDGQAAWMLTSTYRRGMRRLVFRGEGRKTLELTFFLPRLPGPDPSVKLRMMPASSASFHVTFPGKGFRPKLSGGLDTRVIVRAKQTQLRAMLLPNQHPILSWWQSTGQSSRTTQRSKRIARLYAKTYALLSAGRGGQELFLTVRYTIVHAPREQFRLYIPPGIRIRRVGGLGIRDYRLLPAPKPQKGKILDVLLTEPVTERYELSLLAEQAKDTGTIALRLPAPIGVQRETGYLGIEVIGNDALKASATHATTIDVQELPPEITRGTQRPILRAYRFSKRPVSWKLAIQRHSNVSVPAATIDQALYLQVANRDGHTWVQATYQVRNTFKQFIAIKLPKGAEMQSAFVGGKPVKPAKDPKGQILIPLKRSGKAAGHAFSVEVVYSIKGKLYRDRSEHTTWLPSVDCWISRQQWNVYLPQGKVNWLSPKLGQERPHGFSIWSQVTQNRRTRNKWKSLPQQQARIQGKQIHLGQTGQSAGILPIRIQLPKRGRRYVFHQYHLAPATPTKVHYTHQAPYIGTLGLALFLLGGWLLGLALTLMLLRKQGKHPLLWILTGSSIACAWMGLYFTTYVASQWFTSGAIVGVFCAAVLNYFLQRDQQSRTNPPDSPASQDAKAPEDTAEKNEKVDTAEKTETPDTEDAPPTKDESKS